jgi:hypothetical protein
MKPALPNFIFGAIYRTRSGEPDCSATAARYCCYTPAYRDIPPRCHLADCWVCDEFGRIDPGLSASPIPVRHQDLGVIVNVVARDAD